MAFIQNTNALWATHLQNCKPSDCEVINFVSDRYDFGPKNILKQEEREKRETVTRSCRREYHPHGTLELPDWKVMTECVQNKANLLNYIDESWIGCCHLIPANMKLLFGGMMKNPGQSVLTSDSRCEKLPELACVVHEQADKSLFTHMSLLFEGTRMWHYDTSSHWQLYLYS